MSAVTETGKSRIRKREFRDLKTSWIEAGDPHHPILLFLHGFPDSAETWKFQIDHFKKNYHVISPFVRGALPSDPAEHIPRYSTKSEALDILQILKTIDPHHKKKIVCVGHDLGSPVAWKLAGLLSHRLAGLVILNGLALEQMRERLMKRPKQWLKSWYVFPMQVPFLPEFLFSHFSQQLIDQTHKSGGFPKPEESPKDYAQQFILGPLNQYRAFTRELLAGDKVTKISVPTLILWSNRDNYLLHPTLEELEPLCSDVSVRILEGRHWIHQDRHEMFNEVLEEFLKGCFYAHH
jgi:epoxide hydrolase 4